MAVRRAAAFDYLTTHLFLPIEELASLFVVQRGVALAHWYHLLSAIWRFKLTEIVRMCFAQRRTVPVG